MKNFSVELENEDLIKLLLSGGYERDSKENDKTVYLKIYYKPAFCMWVTFDLVDNTVHLYEEYSCGGCVGESKYDIPEDVLEDTDKFEIWWDDTISHRLEGYQ